MPVALDTLVAVNREFFAERWTQTDLKELLQPRHGVVSGFQAILDDLALIVGRDLGDLPLREPDSRGER
jgi:hypothetical protein